MGTSIKRIKPQILMDRTKRGPQYRSQTVDRIKFMCLIATVNFLCLNVIVVKCNKINSSSSSDSDSDNSSQYKLTPLPLPYNQNQNATEVKVQNEMFDSNSSVLHSHHCPSEPMIWADNANPVGRFEDLLPKFTLIAEDETGNISHIPHDGLLYLMCKGNRPVTWQFQGFLNLREVIKSLEIKREASDPRNSATFCYTATINITMPRPKKFAGAGLYICSYVDSPKNQKSIYLYGNDNLPNILARPEGNDFITVKSFKGDETVVPCIGNFPNMTVEITKRNPQGEFMDLDEARFNVEYNPKVGFTISEKNISTVKSDLHGKYRCRSLGAGLKNDTIQVTLEAAGDKPEWSNKLEILIQDYGRCKRFVCLSKLRMGNVSGNISDWAVDKNLELSVIKCNNPIQCQFSVGFLEQGLDSPEVARNEPDTCGHQKDISLPNDDNYMAKSIKVRSAIKAGVVICRTHDKKEFTYSHFFPSVSGSSDGKVVLTSGSRFHPNLRSEIHPSSSFSEIDPRSVVTVLDPKPKMYVKEEHQISCDTSSFLLANGSKLLVQYANGSVSMPHILERKDYFLSGDLKTETDTLVNITTKDIVGFICLAPLWDSEEWINQTHSVNVSEGVLPEFVDVSDSDVVLYDTDANKTLICEAGGSPPPQIVWYKNDEPFEDNVQNAHTIYTYFENSTRSTLVFNHATFNAMNVAGIYVCNATNIKGTSVYPITVQVQSYSTIKYWAPALGIFFFISVIILVFFLCKFWKKSAKQERYIRQLTKQDIQEFKYGRRSAKAARSDSLCSTAGLHDDYANVSGGVEHALDMPYDEKRFEVAKGDLIIDEDACKLGEGNFGKVLKGTLFRDHSKIEVAVKMLKQWDVDAAKMLLHELKILTYIGTHENVVSLLGAVTTFSQFKIQLVLEFCEEGSLEIFLKLKRGVFQDEINNGEIKYSQAHFNAGDANANQTISNYVKADYSVRTFDLVRWAHQFARGMEYVSSKKIIHGDLAARNLLLTDMRELKITDFGLSKKLKNYQRNYIPSLSSTEREQPWRSLAVECWGDNSQLSTESDVWAYGITLWEIFSLAQEPYYPDYPIFTPDFSRNLLAGYRMAKPPYANAKIFDIMKNCWNGNPHFRPKFSVLVKEFEKLLPGNYVKSLAIQSAAQQNGSLPGQTAQDKKSQAPIARPRPTPASKAVSNAVSKLVSKAEPKPVAPVIPVKMPVNNAGGYVSSDQIEQFEIQTEE